MSYSAQSLQSLRHLHIEPPSHEGVPARLEASVVIWKLAQGNKRYCEAKNSPDHTRPMTKLVDLLIEDPIRPRPVEALVFACAISYAPTDAVFDAEPGQIQVVRVCGNVCEKNDGVIGSLEFALAAEMPPVLLVLGNSMNELVDAAVIHAMRAAGRSADDIPDEPPHKGDPGAVIDLVDALAPAAHDALLQEPNGSFAKLCELACKLNVRRAA